MPIRLALLLFPLVEIAGFVWIGGYLGVGGTLAFVLVSTIVGISLLRAEGIRLLLRLRVPNGTGRSALAPLLDGAGRIISALLLIIPGFVSTALGLVLLLRPARLAALRWIVAHSTAPGPATIIETEFHTIDGSEARLPRQQPPV